jgi:WD40 repeat protein
LIVAFGVGRWKRGRKFFVAFAYCVSRIAPEVRIMKVRGSLGILATLLAVAFLGTSSAGDVKERAVLEGPARSGFSCLAFSADGTRLAGAGRVVGDSKAGTGSHALAIVWDVAKQQQVCAPAVPNSTIQRVWISPDGKTIVTQHPGPAGRPTFLCQVWDGATGKARGVIAPKDGGLTAAALSPDGASLAVAAVEPMARKLDGFGCRVGDIALWDLKTMKLKSTLPGTVLTGSGYYLIAAMRSPLWVEALAFSPDGTHLAALGGGKGDPRTKVVPDRPQVKLWELKTGRVTARLSAAEGFMAGDSPPLEWLADGKTLLLRWGTALEVWDTSKEEPAKAFSLTGLPVELPADKSSPQPELPGTHLSLGDGNGASLAEFEGPSVLSADGTRLAVQMVRVYPMAKPPTLESEVVVWDVAARRPAGAVKLEVPPSRFKLLANVVKASDGKLMRRYQGFRVPIALSPDGKLLAIADQTDPHVLSAPEGPVRVYDVSKLSAPAVAADAARLQSKWEGTARHEYVKDGAVQRSSSAVKLVITERNGDAFKAERTGENGMLELAGTIDKSGNVKWEVKRIIKGQEKFNKELVGGLIGSGTLRGNNISLNWSVKGTSHRGTIELELKE